MKHVLPLYAMALEASLDGMAFAEGMLPIFEIVQRIKEAMEPLRDDAGAALDFIYPVPGHPPMQPEPGYVIFVGFPFSCLLFN